MDGEGSPEVGVRVLEPGGVEAAGLARTGERGPHAAGVVAVGRAVADVVVVGVQGTLFGDVDVGAVAVAVAGAVAVADAGAGGGVRVAQLQVFGETGHAGLAHAEGREVVCGRRNVLRGRGRRHAAHLEAVLRERRAQHLAQEVDALVGEGRDVREGDVEPYDQVAVLGSVAVAVFGGVAVATRIVATHIATSIFTFAAAAAAVFVDRHAVTPQHLELVGRLELATRNEDVDLFPVNVLQRDAAAAERFDERNRDRREQVVSKTPVLRGRVVRVVLERDDNVARNQVDALVGCPRENNTVAVADAAGALEVENDLGVNQLVSATLVTYVLGRNEFPRPLTPGTRRLGSLVHHAISCLVDDVACSTTVIAGVDFKASAALALRTFDALAQAHLDVFAVVVV